MVKSLKFLRHRRTEAGYFSEFMIAKTNENVENRAPLPSLPLPLLASPQQPKPQPQQLLNLQPRQTDSVIIGPAAGASYLSLYNLVQPVARHEEVVAAPSLPLQLPEQAASPSQRKSPSPPPVERSQDPLRLARRRERNRAAAAKCRQRRQDRLDDLADCVRQLEDENAILEAEVADLAEARAQLETVVRSHQAECGTPATVAALLAAATTSPTTPKEVWLTPAMHAATFMHARRPTSLSLSPGASSDDQLEPPSLLTTPRVSGGMLGDSGSGLTPLLATPQSAAFGRLESMMLIM